jgi:hypothetical protein
VRHPVGTRLCQISSMDEFFIGAGALLTAGEEASIRGATLHARPESGLSAQVGTAVIDFEAARLSELSRLLIVAAGWSGGRFRAEVVSRLLERSDCSLSDVISILAKATGASEVHLFAHWQPDESTLQELQNRGIRVAAHPLEAIGQAALVCGQRMERWPVQGPHRVRKHDAA